MRKFMTWLLFASAFLTFVMAFFGDRGLIRWIQLRNQVRDLRVEQFQLDEENRRIYLELERIHQDPYQVEKIAREQLGLVQPGDVVIRLPESPDS